MESCASCVTPINIWIAEVITGYYLATIWRRRAWFYSGKWAQLDGTITLAYGPLWNFLGALYELSFPLIYEPVPAIFSLVLAVQWMAI